MKALSYNIRMHVFFRRCSRKIYDFNVNTKTNPFKGIAYSENLFFMASIYIIKRKHDRNLIWYYTDNGKDLIHKLHLADIFFSFVLFLLFNSGYFTNIFFLTLIEKKKNPRTIYLKIVFEFSQFNDF